MSLTIQMSVLLLCPSTIIGFKKKIGKLKGVAHIILCMREGLIEKDKNKIQKY